MCFSYHQQSELIQCHNNKLLSGRSQHCSHMIKVYSCQQLKYFYSHKFRIFSGLLRHQWLWQSWVTCHWIVIQAIIIIDISAQHSSACWCHPLSCLLTTIWTDSAGAVIMRKYLVGNIFDTSPLWWLYLKYVKCSHINTSAHHCPSVRWFKYITKPVDFLSLTFWHPVDNLFLSTLKLSSENKIWRVFVENSLQKFELIFLE